MSSSHEIWIKLGCKDEIRCLRRHLGWYFIRICFWLADDGRFCRLYVLLKVDAAGEFGSRDMIGTIWLATRLCFVNIATCSVLLISFRHGFHWFFHIVSWKGFFIWCDWCLLYSQIVHWRWNSITTNILHFIIIFFSFTLSWCLFSLFSVTVWYFQAP